MKRISILLFFVMNWSVSSAQSKANLDALYEQATEASGLVVQYGQDFRGLQSAYGPPTSGRWGQVIPNSPEQIDRLVKLNLEYLEKLNKADFAGMSIYGQVDYTLLKRKVLESQSELAKEAKKYTEIEKYVPFDKTIYELEKLRRRGAKIDGKDVAFKLNQALKDVNTVKKSLEKVEKIDQDQSRLASAVVQSLKARLKSIFEFYNEYDPLFTWWVPEPYKAFDEALNTYAKVLDAKSDAKVFNDGSNIGGQPIGSAEMNRLLKLEMIAYTPEELLKISEQEFAWCEAEMLKASREMGFGDNWQAAQEKVKETYVAAGEQPEMVIKLYNDAQEFINKHKLYNAPSMSHETWGMHMMAADRQLVSPFFLGGRDIIISYPTNTMNHEAKLMSMRGNNPYFSRGTVQHELVPGHHLQHFMNSRYKPYRREAFSTPFWTEGWTLYWELLLYNKGFAATPEERIGMLFWRMHRCARITFSIKYHLGEWTPQQCVDHLVNKVGFEYNNAHAEVKRSFEANYGPLYQLAYMIGGLQLFSIHKEFVESGKMTNHEFHDKVIKENYLPMEMVRATLLGKKLDKDYKPNWKFYNFK